MMIPRLALISVLSYWMLMPCAALAQLSITSPADGSIYHPGDSVVVRVDQPSGGLVVLGGDWQLKSSPGRIAAPPYVFTVKIPTDINTGSYTISAITPVQAPATVPGVARIHIDVEPGIPPSGSTLSTSPGMMFFTYSGQTKRANIYLNKSSNVSSAAALTATSADPSIVSVSGSKLTAGVNGSTVVTFSLNGFSVQLPVDNSASALRGDLNGDGVVDADDLNVLLAALNSRSNGASDARDLNGDGLINAADATILASLCTPVVCTVNTSAILPMAPTSLSASGGNEQVILNWVAPPSGAASYSIYEGTEAGAESIPAILTGLTSTKATITGLTNGTTYYFQVVAVNSAGNSPVSNEASAKPVAAGSGSSSSSSGGSSSSGSSGASGSSGSSSSGSTGGGGSGGGGAAAPAVLGMFAVAALLRRCKRSLRSISR